MTYAKIKDGIIIEIINDVTIKTILTDTRFFLQFCKRIDNLDPIPQVGWKYDKETGFSET